MLEMELPVTDSETKVHNQDDIKSYDSLVNVKFSKRMDGTLHALLCHKVYIVSHH